MRLPGVAIALGTALLLASCSGAGSSSEPAGEPGLVGTDWTLTAAALDSIDLTGFGITIQFTDTTMSGSSGVNQYWGMYTATPAGALTLGPLATTRMAGPDDAMAAEQAYLALLATVTGYVIDDDGLALLAEQQDVLRYRSQ
jgi:heat shock protein HslJ